MLKEWEKLFQSTPPRGGDLARLNDGESSARFNPRPRAGATRHMMKSTGSMPFQSTPPRGGDDVTGLARLYFTVSIHAPARGRP